DWSSDVCSSDLKRIGAVVNGMRIRVSTLKREAARKAFREVQLQRVINGIGDALLEFGLEKSIVVDGVEGKHRHSGCRVDFICAKPETRELQGRRIGRKAQRNQCRDEIRLWRIAID